MENPLKKMFFREPLSEKKDKLSLEEWRFKTLLSIVGCEDKHKDSPYSKDTIKFYDLWEEATPDQKRQFLSMTKASKLPAEIIEDIINRKESDGAGNFTQCLPAQRAHRIDDINYYISPKEDE